MMLSEFSLSRVIAAVRFRTARLPDRLRQFRFNRIEKKLKRRFANLSSAKHSVLSNKFVPSPYPLQDFIYKDESWNHVKELEKTLQRKSLSLKHHVTDNACTNGRLTVNKDREVSIFVNGARQPWVYWYDPKELITPFALELTTELNTEFHEYQIAFRCESITERLRFRIVDNNELVFEAITKGFFFHRLHSVPFKWETGREYLVRLFVTETTFQFSIDNQAILTVKDRVAVRMNQGLAVILYDPKGKTIDAKLRRMTLIRDDK